MNIRSALKTALLPACLETTQKMRLKLTETAIESANPVVERAELAIKRLRKYGGFQDNAFVAMVEAMIIIAHGPEQVKKVRVDRLLEGTPPPTFDPLTIVVPTTDLTSHRYTIGVPHILTSGKSRTCLSTTGKMDTRAMAHDEFVLADDLQVEKCIDDLTEAQIRTILSDTTIFAPVLSSLLDAPEPQPAPVTKNDGSNAPL